MLLGFTVVPGVVVGLALLFLRAYDLTADRLAGDGHRPKPPTAT